MQLFFKELFGYNTYCNQKLAGLLSAHEKQVPEKTIRLMSHVLNAHQIWNARINRVQPGVGVWELRPLETFAETDLANHQASIAILDQANPEHTLDYINSHGQAFSNTVRDILFHVINHSNYHRAQIASDLKANGIEPIITDYIFYKR